MKITVMGIDPGSRIVGWAVMDYETEMLMDFGHFCLGEKPKKHRLESMCDIMFNKIKEVAPSCISLEDGYVGINARSSLLLAETRGIVIATARMFRKTIFMYSPTTIKKAATGTGKATKAKMRAFLGKMFNKKFTEDEADAVALCLAHCHSHKAEMKLLQMKLTRQK